MGVRTLFVDIRRAGELMLVARADRMCQQTRAQPTGVVKRPCALLIAVKGGFWRKSDGSYYNNCIYPFAPCYG